MFYNPYQTALKITINKDNALINKNNAVIKTKNVAYVINYGGKYSVILTDSKGKAIAQGKVSFTLNGKKIGVVTTNKNGVATVKLTAKILKLLKLEIKNLSLNLEMKSLILFKKPLK